MSRLPFLRPPRRTTRSHRLTKAPLLPHSSKWRASFRPLTCNAYFAVGACHAMPCGSGRRNVGQELEAPGFTLVTPDENTTVGAIEITGISAIFRLLPPLMHHHEITYWWPSPRSSA